MYNYIVEYYFDGVKDETLTDTKEARRDSQVETYEDKIKEGYVFEKTENLPLTIVEDTSKNVIKVYYKSREDLQYRVEYYYDGKIDDSKTDTFNSIKFGTQIEDYEDKVIDGYTLQKEENLPLTVGVNPEENVIKIYYVKRGDLSYTVNYLEEGTNKVLHDPKTANDQIFGTIINSNEEIISIDGYNYNSVDKESLTIGTGENVINIYYTKRNDLSYTVNYLEEGTNVPLHEPKTQGNQEFQTIIKSSDEKIDIDGYNFVRYDKDTLTITTGENVINIYYTKREDLSYTVNYLEKGTDAVLQTPKTVDNQTFGAVINSEEEKIEIDGYNFDSYDKDTLTIGTSDNIINIYYTKRGDLSYTVNYLEKGTDTVLQTPKTVDNQTFGTVITSSSEVISIDGYNYDSVDKESLTIGTGENVINIYYTKRGDLSYTVNYLEKDTNKVLHDPKTIENQTFGTVIESSSEKIEIDGYNFDSYDKETLTIGTSENIINIYYTKREDLSYTVNYLEKDTNKVLQTPKTVDNQTFGTVITSSNEVISINGYNYDSVDKETLTIGTGENIINIYYTKVEGLSYTVNYLEKDTNKVINPAKTVGNQVFETIITAIEDMI